MDALGARRWWALGALTLAVLAVGLALFHSTSFTWGTILAAVGVFALFGVLFTAPQYFQAILGTDAMGSGLRLLPLIGGLAVGAG
jgi:hypothetical protein